MAPTLLYFEWMKYHYKKSNKENSKTHNRTWLLPHNYPSCHTGLAGHAENPHNPTKTTTTHLSGSRIRGEYGDRITRRPVPLAVYPLQLLWNLIRRSAGASPGSSRIPPNLTTAFPHKGYTARHTQRGFTPTTHNLSTNS